MVYVHGYNSYYIPPLSMSWVGSRGEGWRGRRWWGAFSSLFPSRGLLSLQVIISAGASWVLLQKQREQTLVYTNIIRSAEII